MSMNGIKGPRGNNLRNGRTTFPQVLARQERAKARKAVSDARTPEQQLAELDRAGLVAQKERAKLAARIVAREEAKKKPAPAIVKGDTTVVVAPTGKKHHQNPKRFKKLNEIAQGQASGSPATAK